MSTITQTIARRVCPGLVLYAVAAIATPAVLPMASMCVQTYLFHRNSHIEASDSWLPLL